MERLVRKLDREYGNWLDEMKLTLEASQVAKQCLSFVTTSGDQ